MLRSIQEVPYIGVFKLSSGDEFISRVVEETSTEYTFEKPRCLVPTQNGLQFAPLMMLGDVNANVVIPKPLIRTKPSDALLSQYESVISSILLPKKSGIIS